MFSIYVALWSILALHCANGEKTKDEWSAAIDQLFDDYATAYNAEDEAALDELMIKDFSTLVPGENGETDLEHLSTTFKYHGQITETGHEIRFFCGDGAVCEYTFTIKDASNTVRNGKGITLIVEDEGKLKMNSYSFNFDT